MEWHFDSVYPIYFQIMNKIRHDIISGCYPAGTKIPGVRELAAAASVNPNTMQKALSELEHEGLLESPTTAGRFVTSDPTVIAKTRLDILSGLAKECICKFAELGLTSEQAAKLIMSTDICNNSEDFGDSEERKCIT